jgi:hypothetical protein
MGLNLEWCLLEWKIYHRNFSPVLLEITAVHYISVHCLLSGDFRIAYVDVIRK